MNDRRSFRAERRGLDRIQQSIHALEVARHAVNSPLLSGTGAIAIYCPNLTDGELDTTPLIERLQAMGKTIALPVVSRQHPTMDFYRLESGARLLRNRFGILEPPLRSGYINRLRLSLMFLPLVAFDGEGRRIGMGMGFYDRFLSRLPPGLRPRLIGLAHEVQRSLRPLPQNSWDIPLDGVITESGWQSFRRSAKV